MTAAYGRPSTEEPTLQELEGAITLHSGQAARYGRYWPQYVWTHEQINLLLDQRDHLLNEMAAECLERKHGRVRRLFLRAP